MYLLFERRRTGSLVGEGQRCEGCGGLLKPDVVFFGENVPKPRVERCYAAVDQIAELGGALLVLGSSLTVMSGFRFVRAAAKLDVPVVIVNRGSTRADDLATLTLPLGTSEFACHLAGAVTSTVGAGPRASAAWQADLPAAT